MYKLPDLNYSYDALGRSISTDIMKLHHQKHHQGYVDKLNAALDNSGVNHTESLENLLASVDSLPEAVRQAIRNNGGGHYNHSLFWQWMNPNGGGQPSGELAALIDQEYGSYQGFVDEFTAKSLSIFGSGWCWLMSDGKITTSPNQDSPLMAGGEAPLLGLDVWEHAYYLDYKNKRDDYVAAWWDVVDWQFVDQRYQSSK